MKVTQREAHVFEVDEKGNIGFDFTTIRETEIPLWAEFEEYVENRREEREQMYENEYVSHIGEREYEASIEVRQPE